MFEKDDRSVLSNWMFLVGDVLALELGLMISFFTRELLRGGGLYSPYYILLGFGIAFIVIFIAFIGESYKEICYRGYFLEFTSSLLFVLHVFAACLSLFFILKVGATFSRGVILLWFLSSFVLVYISRVIIKHNWKKRQNEKKSLLLVSDHLDLDRIHSRIEELNGDYKIGAIGLSGEAECTLEGYPLLYGSTNILNYALHNVVDEVLMIDIEFEERADDLMKHFVEMGIPVHYDLGTLFSNFSNYQLYLQNQGQESKIVTLSINGLGERDRLFKRILDIVGSLVGLTITGVVTIFVGPMIYFTSPGSIFFKQDRVGRNGRIFKFYKFRSMYMDAEERKKELMAQNEMQGLMFKMENDPRITPIGKFIRKTSIDELPQFWNVLKGDMSLVGTRPPTIDEYEQYQKHHKVRLAMRPGITGMWQVEGRSDIIDFEEVVELDRNYINRWNLGLDIKLILKTILVVFKKQGAM